MILNSYTNNAVFCQAYDDRLQVWEVIQANFGLISNTSLLPFIQEFLIG
jgi:hypothetical protein